MAVSKRIQNAKSNKFFGNIHKRGLVQNTAQKKKGGSSNIGPIMVGFFLFVVVGSALLQIIRTATTPHF